MAVQQIGVTHKFMASQWLFVFIQSHWLMTMEMSMKNEICFRLSLATPRSNELSINLTQSKVIKLKANGFGCHDGCEQKFLRD